ncbi:hypothetical protein [Blastococcus sp. URHD0036]|uniref:hypothetical protein n=1 Tax=Blastococcus sp. URHD0036 TaxID=1380356 RepID=UPI000496467C|nr:hypothetical protein [Blastococcus sp. URHD0036]
MSEPTTRGGTQPVGAHSAGAFDVRNVIAALIGFYGLVLVVYGIVDPDQKSEGTGDVNANLWSGIVMVLVAAGFALWSRLRPIVVDPTELPAEDGPADDGPGARH